MTAAKPRRKLPLDRTLRRKLMVCLLQAGQQQDYVYILVGYSLSSLGCTTQHCLREHREMVDPEWLRLLANDAYRERVVAELLKKYAREISRIPDDAVHVQTSIESQLCKEPKGFSREP